MSPNTCGTRSHRTMLTGVADLVDRAGRRRTGCSSTTPTNISSPSGNIEAVVCSADTMQ